MLSTFMHLLIHKKEAQISCHRFSPLCDFCVFTIMRALCMLSSPFAARRNSCGCFDFGAHVSDRGPCSNYDT
jgi:hypothetical protein